MKNLVALLVAALVLIPVAAEAGDRFADVIVRLDSAAAPGGFDANRAAAADVAADFGVSPRFTYGAVYSGFAARVPEARLDALRNDPRVASVSYDGTVWASQGNCPFCGGNGGGDTGQVLPWGVDRVGADEITNTGAGIHVYIIDTGIDQDHADLFQGNGFAVETCKGGGCITDFDDDNGHGTHVAGTAGALDNDEAVVGVAPDVVLHAVKVLNRNGSGSFSGVVAGIDWVAQETVSLGVATVANMSLGGGGSKTGSCSSSGFTGSDNLHAAMCNAANVGVVFAVAAGNDGADAEGSIPAAYDDAAITVSATQEGDDWPSWSNWGDNTASWTTNASAPVAIAAPGVSVLSTWNDGGTNTISGTSMASPHTAGAAALFLAASPQSADFSAFTNTRAALLSGAESTGTFSNTSGNPHDEDFLNVRGF